jgi:hypothetical protein
LATVPQLIPDELSAMTPPRVQATEEAGSGAEFAADPGEDRVDGLDSRAGLHLNPLAAVQYLHAAEGPAGVDHQASGEALPRQAGAAGAEVEGDLVALGGRHRLGDVGHRGGAHQGSRGEQVVGRVDGDGRQVQSVLSDGGLPEAVPQLCDEVRGHG